MGNGEQATIESQCENGTWVASTVLPNGADDSLNMVLPSPLPQPDSPEGEQTACGCGVYDMRWVNSGTSALVDYDPNTLIGTDFLCTGGEYITTMECVNGHWTGQPELGAWCYLEPTEDDDMGLASSGTPGPTTVSR